MDHGVYSLCLLSFLSSSSVSFSCCVSFYVCLCGYNTYCYTEFMANKICVYVCTNPLLLSASLYFSKRGAYWDRLCRDVVGSWLVGCHARALWPNGASSAYSYYGTLIGNPTPGIQWYKFRPLGWPLTGEWAPREALFVKLLWPLVVIIIIMYEYMILMHKTF